MCMCITATFWMDIHFQSIGSEAVNTHDLPPKIAAVKLELIMNPIEKIYLVELGHGRDN